MRSKKNTGRLTQEEVKNLGIGSKDLSRNKRIINKDGSFNVRKTGLGFAESFRFYHYLVSVSWPKFILIIFSGYVALNLIFALIYYLIGTDHLLGMIASTEFEKFAEAFFFSAQSFTTVGYGRISPVGMLSSIVASLEALAGLLALALATGLLYGRFSRPIPKIIYSRNALIAPFKDTKGFMFRIANKQKSQMVDVEVRVMLSIFESNNGNRSREFYGLELEYDKINFFPTLWTVNHPIDKKSPLFGLDGEILIENKAEFLVLLKGFDDTFSTTVHDRFSYTAEEVVYGAKFVNIYGVDEEGNGTVALERISDYEKVSVA
jgi:inward rectifier potassium channel